MYLHFYLFLIDNCVYSWGKSARGRLGRLEENCSIPKAVTLPPEFNGSDVISVSSSHGGTLIAAAKGKSTKHNNDKRGISH